MMQKCQDGYYVTFSSLLSLEDYNKEQEAHTRWTRCPVNALKVNALDKASPLYVNTSAFAIRRNRGHDRKFGACYGSGRQKLSYP